jgi:membrane-bound lytic murein transglycosylase B
MSKIRPFVCDFLPASVLLSASIWVPGACFGQGAPSVGEPARYEIARAELVGEMAARHGFDPDSLAALLARASYRQAIVDAMERPYEQLPWHRYRQLFLTPERIAGGLAYWRANAETLDRAQAVYGVSPETLVAILGVETSYGRLMGSHRVLDALTTLGFAYPKRAAFFRAELESFLLLQREEGLDPVSAKGSYAGAMGKPQFIPSSYRSYAVDFDGDGKRDLWGSDADAIGSVANYFRAHGWRPGEPVAIQANVAAPLRDDGTLAGIPVAERAPVAPNTTAGALRVAGVDWREPVESAAPATLIRLDGAPEEYWVGLANFYVITRYNHSNLYAMAVYRLSQELRGRWAEGA